MLEWRRGYASNISEVEAEQYVKEMINVMNLWKKNGKDYDPMEESLEIIPANSQRSVVWSAKRLWNWSSCRRQNSLPRYDTRLACQPVPVVSTELSASLNGKGGKTRASNLMLFQESKPIILAS